MIQKIAKTRTIAIIAGILALLILTALLTFIYMNTSEGNDYYIGGNKLIVVGSEQFKPEIEPYAICLVQEITKDNENDIEKGDIVIYSAYIEDIRAKVCCKVLEERPDKSFFVGTTDTNKGKIIKASEIDSRLVKSYNGTAGISKVLFNQYVLIGVIAFLVLVIIYSIVATICRIIVKP